jgi:hypothetical protein
VEVATMSICPSRIKKLPANIRMNDNHVDDVSVFEIATICRAKFVPLKFEVGGGVW